MDYPVEEFSKHQRELAETMDRDESSGFFSSIAQVSAFMKLKVSNPQEASYKATRFMMIMHYLAQHIHNFDHANFAVCGSDRSGALASEHLLRAVHHFFAGSESASLDPTPQEVMNLAATLRE